jgi:hypothetical protein
MMVAAPELGQSASQTFGDVHNSMAHQNQDYEGLAFSLRNFGAKRHRVQFSD